jgi:hypothetical protein
LDKISIGKSFIDFSKYHTIFCDSLQALSWAYKNGLPKSAIIKTSSPSLLWDKKKNICNIEERWTIEKLTMFQNEIQKLNEIIFDKALAIDGIERELAMIFSQSAHRFQKIVYKAACLNDDDFNNHRLFIYVDGKSGPAGNIMNSPWDQLLSSSNSFLKVDYVLKNDNWTTLTTRGVSYFRRFKIAGFQTAIYRLAIKLMKILPNFLFKREVIMPNENELNIEIAYSLIMSGVKVSRVQLNNLTDKKRVIPDRNIENLYKDIFPLMQKIVEKWVVPPAVSTVMNLFKLHLDAEVNHFGLYVNEWKKVIVKNNNAKQFVLVNAPSNTKGQALAYICRKFDIPLISSQHGVTVEISEAHKLIQNALDNSSSDIVFTYNSKIADIAENTFFNKSKYFTVGMPKRLIRMRDMQTKSNEVTPIVYISTNLYHMGLSLAQKTDYGNAKDEQLLITDVLSKLPHKVCYKTYPEDNRRYADVDPVLKYAEKARNMNLFANKIDMRYLISEYKIFVTSQATSTLGWPIMSGKPVVFINRKYNNPLTNEANKSLSQGIFVFNDDDNDFHKNIREFLSQPIEEIEKLWKIKEKYRKEMLRDYFTEHNDGEAGKRAANIILKEKWIKSESHNQY